MRINCQIQAFKLQILFENMETKRKSSPYKFRGTLPPPPPPQLRCIPLFPEVLFSPSYGWFPLPLPIPRVKISASWLQMLKGEGGHCQYFHKLTVFVDLKKWIKFNYWCMTKAKAASEDNKYKIHRFLIYEKKTIWKRRLQKAYIKPPKKATK
jgi:hypothetical protein